MIKTDILKYLIQQGRGRTQIELARAIHGEDAYPQQVNQDLDLLVRQGAIECRGEGGAADPYRYYPA
jgi:hypothetical protein